MKKFKLNSRLALYDGSQIVMAPFRDLPDELHPVWVSKTGLSAVVVAPFGWITLPVVRIDKAFAGRVLAPVQEGDEVVLVDSSGRPKIAIVHETAQGWGIVDGHKIPIWVDGVAIHPSGLRVTQRGEFLEPIPKIIINKNDDV